MNHPDNKKNAIELARQILATMPVTDTHWMPLKTKGTGFIKYKDYVS